MERGSDTGHLAKCPVSADDRLGSGRRGARQTQQRQGNCNGPLRPQMRMTEGFALKFRTVSARSVPPRNVRIEILYGTGTRSTNQAGPALGNGKLTEKYR